MQMQFYFRQHMTISAYLILICIALGCASESTTNYENPTEAKINEHQKEQIVDDLIELMHQHYVNQTDINKKLLNLQVENYETIDIADYFAELLSKDLQEQFNDKHLVVHHDTAMVKRLTYEQRSVDNWNDIKYFEAYQEHQDAIEDNNFDFNKLEILSGNVGYLKFNYFAKLENARSTIEATMNFFANVDALIIDLQHNSGGHVNTTSFLGSFFCKDSSTVFFRNLPNEGKIRYPVETSTGPPNLKNIPLYVIISEQTASAAEVLTTALKENERARVIGTTSWGGAHACRMVILNEGFAVLLPFSEILGPVSSNNWEAKGIEPDIVKSSKNIIDNVHHLSISDLLNLDTDSKKKYQYSGILKAIESKFYDKKINTESYVGHYGHLQFYVENNQLYYLRDGRYPIRLLSYKKDHFILDNYQFSKMYFNRNFWNKVVSAHFVNYKNDTLSYGRN